MVRLAKRHPFSLSLSYHTQGAEIYWRFSDIEPKEGETIGKAFSVASGYRLADAPSESSYAGFKDWMLLTFGRPSYTVEAGRGTNPLPLSDFSMLLRENRGIFTKALALAPKFP